MGLGQPGWTTPLPLHLARPALLPLSLEHTKLFEASEISICFVSIYREIAARATCYYYYPPCGNITHFTPPNALCQDVCNYLTTDLCSGDWVFALNSLSLSGIGLQLLNCSQLDVALGSMSHCCSDAGINITDIVPGEISVKLLIPPFKSRNYYFPLTNL